MILDTIAASARRRVEKQKGRLPLSELKKLIYGNGRENSYGIREAFAFEKALRKDGISFICEVKKASPSKGVIASDFLYLKIAEDYQEAGADAVSVLTEPEYFQGSDRYLSEISGAVKIPVLRKDFTVDEYQLYEAKYLGADAVLLICALLDGKTLKSYLDICRELGLSALVEAHTEEEVSTALASGAGIIGVNNRNLQTFEVDLNNSIRLRHLIPKDIVFVAESGIKTPEDISLLKNAGVNAVLIGETLMKSENKRQMISYLLGGSK